MRTDLIIYTAAIMAALSAVSCSKELHEGTVPSDGNGAGKIELRIPADEATKTVFGDGYEVKWNDEDKIGVFVGTSANVPASLTRIGGKAYFTATVDEYEAGAVLYAYYPYNANAGTAAGKVTLKIPYQQKQSELSVFNGSYNPMVAVPVKLPAAGEALKQPLKFRHIGAILEFDVTNVPAGETLKSVQFIVDEHSSGDKFPSADDLSYDLNKTEEDVEVDIIVPKGIYYRNVTVALDKSGTASKVYMTLIPGKYTGNIYISTDKSLYRFSGKTIEATRAEVKTITADLSNREASSKAIESALDYEAFAAAANIGDCSAWVDSDGEVKLGENITTDRYFTRIQKDWAGKFNGQNHTITQKNSIVPLFTVINEGAYVKNLVLEGKKTSMANSGTYGSAAIAQINRGTVENVTNKMTTGVKVTSGTAIAGIVICNGGTMKDCTQAGDITVEAEISVMTTLYAGGIAAFASDANEVESSKKAGMFDNCVNKAQINVSRASSKKASLAKFAVGGVCAIVHFGDAAQYPTFSNCRNEGEIHIVDKDGTADAGAVAAGGIIGRISDYFSRGVNSIAFNITEGYYALVSECENSASIETASYSTAPVISGSNTGARIAAAGGIVGYASGKKAKSADIKNCRNSGKMLGGASANCVLGGICGQTNYANIENCTFEGAFGDSSLPSPKLSAAGGIVGSSLNALTVKDCFVDMSGTLTSSPVGIGVLQGYVKSGSATYSNIQVKANLTYGDSKSLEITAENAATATGLYGPVSLKTSGITYWNK